MNSQKSKKIFFLTYSLDKNAGGLESYTHSVLKYLEKLGHKITVMTLTEEKSEFTRIPIPQNKLLRKIFLKKWILEGTRNLEADIYLCGHLFLTQYMDAICEAKSKTYDVFVYGIDCWAGRFEKRSENLKHLSQVVSISSFTSKQVQLQGFSGNIVYLPPVIDLDLSASSRKEANKNQHVSFLTVARLLKEERYKGHDVVLKALKILIDQGVTDISYQIVGRGDDIENLKVLCCSLGLDAYVKFLGFVPDIGEIYKNSDVFVMPSRVSLDKDDPKGEGFGIVFIEAAMHELALIGPNSGGSTDIIDHDKTGLECDPKSPKDVAKKMKQLIDDQDKRLELGKNARRKVEEKFTTHQLKEYLQPLLK